MKRFQSGDSRSFRGLLDRHETRIYNFFLRSFGRTDLARDLTQDTFLRVIRGRDGFELKSKFSTWMWRIAHNLRVDTIRRLQFRNHKSLDVPVHEEGASESAVDRVEDKQDIGSERKTDGARFMEAVESAIPELEPDQREVFVLRQLQGLSFQEIADVQEVNVNTVKSRMRYALQRLRQILEEYAPQKAEAP